MVKSSLLLFLGAMVFQSVSVAQSLESVSVVSGGGSAVCQENLYSAATVSTSCQGSWTDTYGNGGSGSGNATASYGLLRVSGNASVDVVTPVGIVRQTVTQGAGSFQDVLTFPQLTSPAYLKATVTVSGSTSGDPSSYLIADVYMSTPSYMGGTCVVQSLNGSCSTIMPISPGDQVTTSGTFTVNAVATVNTYTVGSSAATTNYSGKKNFGATYSYALTDANGRGIRGTIASASVTTYPKK